MPTSDLPKCCLCLVYVCRLRYPAVRAGNFWAKKLSTVAASPHEVGAPCEHYGRCGGCTLQDLAYPAQLEAKQSEVGDVTHAARDLRRL